MIPPIRIEVAGNSCKCCISNSEKKEYFVVFRGDKNKFVAVVGNESISKESIAATHAALKVLVENKSGKTLDDLEIKLDASKAPTLQQVRSISDIFQTSSPKQ